MVLGLRFLKASQFFCMTELVLPSRLCQLLDRSLFCLSELSPASECSGLFPATREDEAYKTQVGESQDTCDLLAHHDMSRELLNHLYSQEGVISECQRR